MIVEASFRRFLTFGNRRDIMIRVPYGAFSLYERVLDLLPAHAARRISGALLPSVCAAAVK